MDSKEEVMVLTLLSAGQTGGHVLAIQLTDSKPCNFVFNLWRK